MIKEQWRNDTDRRKSEVLGQKPLCATLYTINPEWAEV
jgi:hypothetical protein